VRRASRQRLCGGRCMWPRLIERSMRAFFVGFFVLVSATLRIYAQGDGPRDVVSDFEATLIATMKVADQIGFEGRYQHLQPAMEAAFDLDQMARTMVGAGWTKLREGDHSPIADLFGR